MLILWMALGLVGAVLLIDVALSLYFIRSSFTRPKNREKDLQNHLKKLRANGNAKMADKLAEGKEQLEGLPYEDVFAMANDGLKLHGRIIEPNTPTNKTVILVHGYRAVPAADFAGIWQYYYERNYRILLIDQRAHGESEGHYICFGAKEQYDVANWVEYLTAVYGKEQSIVLHGVSMGASTVMYTQALPENKDRIKAVAADCGYVSPKQQFTHMFHKMRLPLFPLFLVANLCTKLLLGFWFGEVCATKTLAKAQVPVLLIHGETDDFVPTECSRINYAACACPKVIFTVPNAAHASSALVDPKGYYRQLDLLLSDIT